MRWLKRRKRTEGENWLSEKKASNFEQKLRLMAVTRQTTFEVIYCISVLGLYMLASPLWVSDHQLVHICIEIVDHPLH